MDTKPRILIATPMYDYKCTSGYLMSLLRLLSTFRELGWEHDFVSVMGSSIISFARNSLVNAFLINDFTHLLFLDSDISFDANHVVQMVLANKPIVGGVYPIKSINWDWIHAEVRAGRAPDELKRLAANYAFHSLDGDTKKLTGENKLREVKSVATGFMLIQRDVFDSLAPSTDSYATPTPLAVHLGKQEPEYTKEFFSLEIDKDTKMFYAEDTNFCRKWRELGGKVYIAEWAYAQHEGMHTFG